VIITIYEHFVGECFLKPCPGVWTSQEFGLRARSRVDVVMAVQDEDGLARMLRGTRDSTAAAVISLLLSPRTCTGRFINLVWLENYALTLWVNVF
jgi:hypothetical protein